MRLGNALNMFWQLRGHASEPRQFADAMLAQTASDFRLRPAALHLAGAFAYVQGDFDAARRLLTEALAEARTAADWPTVLLALERAGLLAAAADEFAASKRFEAMAASDSRRRENSRRSSLAWEVIFSRSPKLASQGG